MQIQQLSVKVFAMPGFLDQGDLIPIFHRWIREKALPGVLLIDVADYRHVPDGPGVMIIAHEAHYGLDSGDGELGFLYSRKRDPVGDAQARLREAFGAVFQACKLLEAEPSLGGKLRFDYGRLEVRLMSRLVAPNTAEAFGQLRQDLEPFLAQLYGGADVALTHRDDPKRPLAVRAQVAGTHDVNALLSRIR